MLDDDRRATAAETFDVELVAAHVDLLPGERSWGRWRKWRRWRLWDARHDLAVRGNPVARISVRRVASAAACEGVSSSAADKTIVPWSADEPIVPGEPIQLVVPALPVQHIRGGRSSECVVPGRPWDCLSPDGSGQKCEGETRKRDHDRQAQPRHEPHMLLAYRRARLTEKEGCSRRLGLGRLTLPLANWSGAGACLRTLRVSPRYAQGVRT